ncbi:MAG TPA: GNAT family N-acetyltransferase [Verrucomicrobiae bacterium]|nr:GNAT family N-acetyltransferase [Verrucomicrobiae bacterium]
MKPVAKVSEVFDAIQHAKAGAPDFCTNFFPVQKKVQDWIDHDELRGAFRSDAVFFFRRDRDFWHLYYCAASKTALEREIAGVPEIGSERVVLDLVGNEAAVSAPVGVWKAAGFNQRTRLFRMARVAQPFTESLDEPNGKIEFANIADAQAIVDLLESAFDRFGEQLPLLYEIEAAIEARQVLVARHEGNIAGLLFFETQGMSSTLRFWAVAEQYRALKFGSALMRKYFATQNAVKRFVLWVAADNVNAVQKYGHYGYKPDGLVDYVLANRMVRS